MFRNRLKFNITEERAFKNGAVAVILEPTSVGAVPASDLDVFTARSYLIARKRIPKDAHFKLYASCSLKIVNTGRVIHITSESYNIHITSNSESSKELSKFFEDYVNRIKHAVQSDEIVSIQKFEYNFVVIPSGGGRTTSRDEESTMKKKSVLSITNNDKNCFWYAMACLLHPKNRQIRDARNTNARIEVASQICSKAKLDRNKPVPLHFICLVEEAFNININVIDKYNIPMLGSNVNIFNLLMYKSDNRHREHYFLLYDNINEHYDCITDIKKFLAVRFFCFNCFKGFTHRNDYEKHECDTNLSKKRR